MSKCAKCGTELAPGMKFCCECGTPVPQTKICPNCGTELMPSAKFCFNCGGSVNGASTGTMRNSGIIVDGHAVVGGDLVNNVTNNSYVVHDASKETVSCSRCGHVVTVTETFKCRVCGETNICRAHYSQAHNCCESCAAKLDAPEFTRKALAAYAEKDYVEAFRLALKAETEKGEVAYIIGYGYENGKGVEADAVQAVHWYRKGAEAGHLRSQNALGCCYLTGKGVTQDENEGVKWLRRAAEGGDMLAQRNYGDCFYHGQGVPEDMQQAFSWYRKSAEQGWAHAQYDLAECYLNGWGVDVDEEEAAAWMRKAADQMDGEFQFGLGKDCENRGVGNSGNKIEAAKWYFMAAQQGNVEARAELERLKNLKRWQKPLSALLISRMHEGDYLKSLSEDPQVLRGLDFWHRGEYPNAVAALRTCDQSDPVVLYCLGDLYGRLSDRAGLVRDETRAYRYMRASADAGNTLAFWSLAWKECIRKNFELGARLLQQAADRGHESAIQNLIFECRGEEGCHFAIKRDDRKAAAYAKLGVLMGAESSVGILEAAIENPKAWFMAPEDFTMLRQAYEKLDAKYRWASYHIGQIYEKGLEGRADYVMAKKWYEYSQWNEAKKRLESPEFQEALNRAR